MEKLQDGDRFYYLERTQGLNFLTELENNSFAKLIMANTDATHLPGDVFTTPGFTLEVDQTLQFTGLGPTAVTIRRGDRARRLRMRAARRPGHGDAADPNYLEYTGDDHVVLGGTAGNDTLISSIGDDTLYGDGGDDRLDGGDGNDIVFGGAGDDIITDLGGDDIIQGGDGNDAIHGGNGVNLILGGFGNDFIVTGEDPSEVLRRPRQRLHPGRARQRVRVRQRRRRLDRARHGRRQRRRQLRPVRARPGRSATTCSSANTITDRMDGEGGDDIMVGNGGQVDRYEGGSGFDWAVFKDDAVRRDRRPAAARLRRDAGAAVQRDGAGALHVDRRPVGFGRMPTCSR